MPEQPGREAIAAAWGIQNQGKPGWYDQCQLFVETAYGTRGQFTSALTAGNALLGKTPNRDLSKARPGDLVYFSADDTNNGAGHVGIYVGGGKMISATYAGVKVDDVANNPYWSSRLRGTVAPPETWTGRAATPDLAQPATQFQQMRNGTMDPNAIPGKTVRQQAQDALNAVNEQITRAEKDLASIKDPTEAGMSQRTLAELYARRNEAIAQVRLAEAAEKGDEPSRTAAQDDLAKAQADLARAQAANVGNTAGAQIGADASVRSAQIGAAASTQNAQTAAAASKYAADIQAATAAADLQWRKEQAAITDKFNNRQLSLQEAQAAATEAYNRINAQLAQTRNAIEQRGQDLSARNADLQAQVSQRNTDAQVGAQVRGQDVDRLNTQLEAGASMSNAATSAAATLGSAASQAAVSSLPFIAPPGTAARNAAGNADLANIARPGAWQEQVNLPNVQPMAFPFDPANLGTQVALSALSHLSPMAQQLLGRGMQQAPGFTAPQTVVPQAIPQGVPTGPMDLPGPFVVPGQFTAPVTVGAA